LPGSARCRERATFVSAKVAKTIARGHDGFSNIVLPKLSCASRRSRAGANSHLPVLEHARLSRAIGCDARRHARRWKAHPLTAIHGLRHSMLAVGGGVA